MVPKKKALQASGVGGTNSKQTTLQWQKCPSIKTLQLLTWLGGWGGLMVDISGWLKSKKHGRSNAHTMAEDQGFA